MSEGPQEIHPAGHGDSLRSARGTRNAELQKKTPHKQAHSGEGLARGGWVGGGEGEGTDRGLKGSRMCLQGAGRSLAPLV